MFAPLKLRALELKNRVAVSPMCMYSAEDGTPTDFHLVHLGSRAMGGAGLVYTEMTNVARDARISPGCAGMYKPEHLRAWKRIVDFVHESSDAKIAMQLGHAGPKGSTKLLWEGVDEPLDEGNWPIIGPSATPYFEINQVPRAMTRDDMDRVISEFESATRMGGRRGIRPPRDPRGTRLSPVGVHNTALEQAGRRLRRYALEPPPLSCGGHPPLPGSLAVKKTSLGAHLGNRLSRRRDHGRRCRGDSPRSQRRGCRYHQRLRRPNEHESSAGLPAGCSKRRSAIASATKAHIPTLGHRQHLRA